MPASGSAAVRALARAHGIQQSFVDTFARRRGASTETLLAALAALGAPIRSPEEAPAALRDRTAARWGRLVEPVVVAWQGSAMAMDLRVPTDSAGRYRLEIGLEDGGVATASGRLADLPGSDHATVAGRSFVVVRAPLPPHLPGGAHRVEVAAGRRRGQALLVISPARAPRDGLGRWGVFLPLYALRTRRDWGVGDFGGLADLMRWTGAKGGDVVATLPLLSAFLDRPFEPSPYAPASRLFWNEVFVDVEQVPEARTPAVAALLRSDDVRKAVRSLRRPQFADHAGVMALKRRILEACAAELDRARSDRRQAHRRFVRSHPALDDYARFRAETELRGAGWPAWSGPARDGSLGSSTRTVDAVRYHRYVQWLAEEQLSRAVDHGRTGGVGLLLDMPLGVHPDSYDTWRHREVFALSARAGAPPDRSYASGQDWGFPPIHPERSRETGHAYFRACLRHLLRHADVLRIDHVMNLHRLYWIPPGADATGGVYVRYPTEELYALLVLEASRAGASVEGEDIGTVPPTVRPAMARHGLLRTYVAQAEARDATDPALPPVPPAAVASVDTHDTAPFAAWWDGEDVERMLGLGLLTPEAARAAATRRAEIRETIVPFLESGGWLPSGPPGPDRVLRGILAYLADGDASAVIVSLEDLWLERRRQNLPGTWRDHPNWQGRARHALEEIDAIPGVKDLIAEVRTRRKGRARRP
jgi:4-alpha-glucanotransferase